MSTIGDLVGLEVARSLGDSPTSALRDAKRAIWERIGTAFLKHVPGFMEVKFDPSADGLDLPVPSIVNQVDPDTGEYVAVWWKCGPAPKDWTGFGGGRWEQVTVNPSTAGLARDMMTLVWQTDGGTPAKPLALWLKNDSADTGWSRVWPAVSSEFEAGYRQLWEINFADLATGDWSDGTQTIAGKTVYTVHSDRASVLKNHHGLGLMFATTQGNASAELWDDHVAPMISIPIAQNMPAGLPTSAVQEWWVWFYIVQSWAEVKESLGGSVGTHVGYAGYRSGVVCGVETYPHTIWRGAGINDPFCSRAGCIDNPFGAKETGAYKIIAGYTPPSGLNLSGGNENLNADPTVKGYETVIALRMRGPMIEVYTGYYLGGWPSRSALVLTGQTFLGPAASLAWRRSNNEGHTINAFFACSESLDSSFVLNGGIRRMRVEILPPTPPLVSTAGGGTPVAEAFTSVTIASNGLSGFGAGRTLLVDGDGPLNGIDTTGLNDGESITLARKSGSGDLTIAHAAATSYAPIQGPATATGYISPIVPEAEEVRLRLHLTGSGAPFWKYIGGSAT